MDHSEMEEVYNTKIKPEDITVISSRYICAQTRSSLHIK